MITHIFLCDIGEQNIPDNKVHGAHMGPTWVLSAPDGPRVGPMNELCYQEWVMNIILQVVTWCIYARTLINGYSLLSLLWSFKIESNKQVCFCALIMHPFSYYGIINNIINSSAEQHFKLI